MVDILDAAQIQTPTAGTGPVPTDPTTPLPPEPAPVPPTSNATPADDMPVPPPPPALTDDLVVPPPTEENKPPEPKKEFIPPNTDKPKKKRTSPAAVITGIILLLITLPLAGLAVKNNTEIRSQAGKINTAKAQKAIVKLQSDKSQKAYADARINDAKNGTNTAASTDVGKFLAAQGTGSPANPGTNSTANTAPIPVTTSATCAGTSGEGAIACEKNPPVSASTTTDPNTGKITTTIVAHPFNGMVPDYTQPTYTIQTTKDASGKITAQTLTGVNGTVDLLAMNASYDNNSSNPTVGKPCSNSIGGACSGSGEICGSGGTCQSAVGKPCTALIDPVNCGTGAMCGGGNHTCQLLPSFSGIGGTPIPASPPQVYNGTAACKQMSDEAALACNKNPPDTLIIGKDTNGTETVTIVGHPFNGMMPDLTAPTYTLTTTKDSSGKITAQTLSTINGTVDLLAINATYAVTPNPNIGKICNRGAVGSNSHGAAVSSCGNGAACVNNICVAASGPACIMASNDSTDPCTGGSKCVGALHVEGPKGGVAMAPGFCVPVSQCQACAGAGNSASECSAVCNVQTPNIFLTPTTPPGGGGGSPGGGGGGGGGGNNPPPQCVSIVIYKDGNALGSSDLAALHPGDTVTLAYAPGGNATKVRFQITADGTAQGWNESTTKNTNSQFTWSYTLTSATSFSIAAQWFDGTNWNE